MILILTDDVMTPLKKSRKRRIDSSVRLFHLIFSQVSKSQGTKELLFYSRDYTRKYDKRRTANERVKIETGCWESQQRMEFTCR